MVRTIDRVFGWLMVVGALLHCMGTLTAHLGEDVTLWSLGAGLGELLLAAINLMRVGRPADRTLAWVSFRGLPGLAGGDRRLRAPDPQLCGLSRADPGRDHAGADGDERAQRSEDERGLTHRLAFVLLLLTIKRKEEYL